MAVALPSGDAHSPQNLASGVLALPQFEHKTARGKAHSLQNLRPSSLAVPHLEQITFFALRTSSRCRRGYGRHHEVSHDLTTTVARGSPPESDVRAGREATLRRPAPYIARDRTARRISSTSSV